jgi:hypothetical protein
MRKLGGVATVVALGSARLAFAAGLDLPEPDLSLEAHGFASQGFIKTTANNYLAPSKRGSFEFTEVGINFTSQLTERLRFGVQLFARQLGPIGNYNAKADWFYLDYRFRDWLGFRAGRIKLPFGLYNDTSDIDAARVAILLPQSIYSLTSRDFLLAQTGAEVYGYLNLRRGGGLEYRIYGGTIFLELPPQYGAPLQITSTETPYIVGGRLMWETPVDGLRVGGSVQDLRLDLGLLSGATLTMQATPSTARISALLWVTSLEYSAHDLLLAVEYSRWRVKTEASDPMLVPPGTPAIVSERAYAMAAYRVRYWFQPGTTYSVFFPNVDNRRRGSDSVQHDVAATLRFDVNAHWLVKLEGHFMRGTAGLQSALNNNTPVGLLTQNWAVFLIKTTAYF